MIVYIKIGDNFDRIIIIIIISYYNFAVGSPEHGPLQIQDGQI